MLDLPYILRLLQDRSLKVVSERSGVPYANLCALVAGRVKDPRYETVLALAKYFTAQAEEVISKAGGR